MIKIKGVNVFPKQIEEILQEFPELSSEYQIRISHLDGKDTMRIYVETNGTVDFWIWPAELLPRSRAA